MLRAIVIYISVIAAAVVLFLLIQGQGESLRATLSPPTPTSESAAASEGGVFWHLLLALAAVVTVGRLLGIVFRYISQPPVIGEVIGGILLGPSLLGSVWPEAYAYILPSSVVPSLFTIAQLGVILYMFLVGLDLNPDWIRHRIHTTIAISHASIIAPFLMGSALALFLYPEFGVNNIPFNGFALFLGLAMSITAFPVLARILSDSKLTKTELGAQALACASIDDVTAWCVLAFVVGVVQSTGRNALSIAILTVGFILFLFFIVRPLAVRFASRDEKPSRTMIAAALVAMLASALITEAIGIHAIFGAFLLGAIIPHESRLARSLTRRLEDLVTILLLPAFFAFTGMRTEIALVSNAYEWLVCGLIIAVATAGKFGGTLVAARLTGVGWRHASALGVLMNTRGLMELIVLNVGLDLGVLSQKLFTMMVLMALVTTIATTPILRRLIPNEPAAKLAV
jgi:Kef-type K+ transport system membrane component KefB